MPERVIEAPAQEWLTEEEAISYLRVNGFVFHRLVDAGFVAGVRRLSRQLTLYHWKGVLMAQWRLELGDLPPDFEGGENSPKVGKSGEKSRKLGESGAEN